MPHAQILRALEGHPGGRILIASLEDDPAAGADVSITVPGRATWELLALNVAFVTDATVTNRTTFWLLDDGQHEFWRMRASGTTAASLTHHHVLSPTFSRGQTVTTIHQIPIPDPCILLPGWRIRTTTTSLQAGDNYGAPVLYVREIPERGEDVWDELARSVAREIIERRALNV